MTPDYFFWLLETKLLQNRQRCMNKIVLVTGGFDPIHSGHIAFLKAAKQLGGHLVVGVNSDAWLCRKKGKAFMSFDERCAATRC